MRVCSLKDNCRNHDFFREELTSLIDYVRHKSIIYNMLRKSRWLETFLIADIRTFPYIGNKTYFWQNKELSFPWFPSRARHLRATGKCFISHGNCSNPSIKRAPKQLLTRLYAPAWTFSLRLSLARADFPMQYNQRSECFVGYSLLCFEWLHSQTTGLNGNFVSTTICFWTLWLTLIQRFTIYELPLITIEQSISKFTSRREYQWYQNIRNHEFEVKFPWTIFHRTLSSSVNIDVLIIKL